MAEKVIEIPVISTALANFVAAAYKMPPHARLSLVERFDSIDDRNRATFMSCFALYLMVFEGASEEDVHRMMSKSRTPKDDDALEWSILQAKFLAIAALKLHGGI